MDNCGDSFVFDAIVLHTCQVATRQSVACFRSSPDPPVRHDLLLVKIKLPERFTPLCVILSISNGCQNNDRGFLLYGPRKQNNKTEPTLDQCRVHIEAAIKGIENEAGKPASSSLLGELAIVSYDQKRHELNLVIIIFSSRRVGRHSRRRTARRGRTCRPAGSR